MNKETVLKIFGLCREKKAMLSVCESLTGGLITHFLISVEGASEFVYEGITAYSNDSKIRRLYVKEETLKKFGAVSAETAAEMALGLYCGAENTRYSTAEKGADNAGINTRNPVSAEGNTRYNVCEKIPDNLAENTRYSTAEKGADNADRNIRNPVRVTLSSTGIAGPDGGSAEKPVGLTFIGVCADGNPQTYKYIFRGGRTSVREQAALEGLKLLEKTLETLN